MPRILPPPLSSAVPLLLALCVLAPGGRSSSSVWAQPPEPKQPAPKQPTRPAVGAPVRTIVRVGEPGTLTATDKYVFVLLNGVLFQYDVNTLKLINHVEVVPPGGVWPGAAGGFPGWPMAPAVMPNRAWLGIEFGKVSQELAKQRGLAEPTGVLIRRVVEGSPAERAGLKADDIVLTCNDAPIATAQDLVARVAALKPGAEVKLEVLRDGERKTVTVPLGRWEDALKVPAAEPVEGAAHMQLNVGNNRVTLDVMNADLADVLRLLSKQTGKKIVFGVEPKRQVTASLTDKSLEEALDLLVRTAGLTWRKTEDGTYVVEAAKPAQ